MARATSSRAISKDHDDTRTPAIYRFDSIGAGISRRATLALISAALLIPRFARTAGCADAKDQIARFNAALLEVMSAEKRTSFAARSDALGSVVDQVFGLDQIFQISVGPYGRGLPEGQRSTLASVFRRFVVASYVLAFDGYNGKTARVLPDVRSVGMLWIVSSAFTTAGDWNAITSYVMVQSREIWRAQEKLKGLSLQFNATNLLNATYYSSCLTFGEQSCIYGAGRVVYGTLAYRW